MTLTFYRSVEFFAKLSEESRGWRRETFLRRLGALGHLLLAIARRTGFIKNMGGRWKVDFARMAAFRRCSEAQISVQWVGQALINSGWVQVLPGEDYDQVSWRCRKAVEAFLKDLQENGLWGYRESFRRGSKNTPTLHSDINPVAVLMLYEHLEKIFVERFGWESLPDHKGAAIRDLFNAVFKGLRSHNRVPGNDSGVWSENHLTQEVMEYCRDRLAAVAAVIKGKKGTRGELKVVLDADPEVEIGFLCPRAELSGFPRPKSAKPMEVA